MLHAVVKNHFDCIVCADGRKVLSLALARPSG